jgi:hypothetical protein
LEAGPYVIKVTAPGHGSFTQTKLLEPGENSITAFLPKQLVSYEWTVVPIPFTDQYTISIQMVFETNVPAPVINYEPLVINFRDMEQESEYREVAITNHGLIAARDFHLTAQSSQRYELIPLEEEIGDILPGETKTVSLLLIDHGFGLGSGGGFRWRLGRRQRRRRVR